MMGGDSMIITKEEFLLKIKNLASKISTAPINSEDLVSYYRYFEVKYGFYEDSNATYLLVYLTLKYSDVVIAYIEYAFSINGVTLNSYNVSMSKNKRDFLIFIPFMVNELVSNNSNFSYDAYNHYKSVVDKARVRAENEFFESLDEVSMEMDKKEKINTSIPVHLYPVFENIGDRYALSLKIGRSSKTYVVKSIKDLIYGIKNNHEKKFGKELSIVLSLDIFDEQSRRLIDLITTSITMYGASSSVDRFLNLKYVPIALKILEIYKGNIISFDNQDYLVRLNEIDVKIHIDKDYYLSLDLPELYIYESELGCLINSEEHIIDKIKGDESYLSLLNVIDDADYPCIENHIDEFKYKIILRYMNRFTFDESIENEFIFEEMKINVYFDLEKETINYHDELFDVNGILIGSTDDLNPYNRAQYNRYKHILDGYGFDSDNKLTNPTDVWNFLVSDFSELKKVADVYLSDNIQNKVTSTFVPPQIRVSYNSSMLDVFINESEYSEEELMKIYLAIKHKKKYIFLKNNVINLEDASSEEFKNHVEEYGLLEKNQIKTYQKLPVYYAFKSLDGVSGITLSEEVRNVLTNIKNFKNSDIIIPEINGELREYQKDGVRWLTILYNNHLCGVLADDMGLGKTIEIIAFLKGIKKEAPILIVCPKSLIFNWVNEFSKFDPDTKVKAIYGARKDREKTIKNIKDDKKVIYLTSYDSLRQDEELYNDIKFEVMILDEAQAIKNSRAKKTISVTHINSEVRFVLTGTPIENSILDLWSIFNFLMPGYLSDIDSFKMLYESSGEEIKSRLKKKIAPFILRRNKKDVLKDLPPKYELIMTSEMNSSQKKIYEAHRVEARNILKDGGKAFDVLYLLTRLRQICIDPSLFIDNYHDGSGKIDTLMEIIDEKISEGHRMLIFSQFVKALELVEQKLRELDIAYLMITGKTDGEERINIVNEFNRNKKYKIVLISLKAGGTGLNLVGADTVIHLDPWWNVAAQDQATDRAHRIGQEKNVEVIKLISLDSIEQRVVELQNIKKELIASLISDDESSITNLSLEDIGFILS